MKYLFTLYLLSIGILSYEQTIPTEIKSAKTSAHINMPRSKVFIVPPQGFTPSNDVSAIQNEDKAVIRVAENPDGNFYISTADFSRAAFEAKGIKILDYKELTINGYPAKMILTQSPDGTNVYTLAFGDTTFFVAVMGAYSSTDSKMGTDLQKAMQTIYYDKSFKVDPFAYTTFTLDDSQTRLKFFQYKSDMYIYYFNGQEKLPDSSNAFFMVTPLPAEGLMPAMMADIMLGNARKYGLTVLSADHVVTGKTNGFPSFQREIYGTNQGKEVYIYQHVVVIGETAVVMQGQANKNFPVYLKDFQALSNTIRKK